VPHAQTTPLPFILVSLAFLAITGVFAYSLWRRDRPFRPGHMPLYSLRCGARAGLAVGGFERIELWPDVLVLKSLGLAIPYSAVHALSVRRQRLGALVTLEHEQGWYSPLVLAIGQPEPFLSFLQPLLPASVRNATPPQEQTPA
jgi:hypothetical protein